MVKKKNRISQNASFHLQSSGHDVKSNKIQRWCKRSAKKSAVVFTVTDLQ